MQRIEKNFQYYLKVVKLLELSGMTAKYSYAATAVYLFRKTRNTRYIRELLNRFPHLIEEALHTLAESPYAPEPIGSELELLKGLLNLGHTLSGAGEINLDPFDFIRGFLGLGPLGSGKSYPILRIIRQMLLIPIEERGFNLLIVQALKRDSDFLIREFPTLRIIEWKNLRRAPLAVEDWDDIEKKQSSFRGVFSTINWLMSNGQPLFRGVLEKCCRQNGVLNGSNNFPNFTEINKEIDNVAKEMGIDGFEHRNVRDHLKSVTQALIDTKEIVNGKHGFTVEDFFSKGDIILNVLPEDESSDYVVGTTLVDIFKDLQRFNERHPISPPRLRTLIIIDECRRLFPNSGNIRDSYHNPHATMESWATTRRTSGIGLIAITQEPSSIPHWLLSNSAFIMAFPIAGPARKDVQELLNLTKDQVKSMDRLPKWTAIFRDERFTRPYLLKAPGDLEVVPITLEEVDSIMRPYIEERHAEILTKAPAENKFKPYSKEDLQSIKEIIHDDTFLILEILQKNPFLYRTLLSKKVGGGFNKFDASIKWLKKEGLIESISCISGQTGPGEFYPLTEKAHDLLNTPIDKRKPASSRFEHTYYQIKTFQGLKVQGFEPQIEYTPEGSKPFKTKTGDGKEITVPPRMDVFALQNGIKTAYEVTLSFSNLRINVYKCLIRMEMDVLYIVCRDQNGIAKAKNILSDIDPESKLGKLVSEKLRYAQIKEFL